jgi:AraC-like DNA-binding protein
MLWETDLQQGEIAERIGYESLPAFSRVFKAQFGLSPTAAAPRLAWHSGIAAPAARG